MTTPPPGSAVSPAPTFIDTVWSPGRRAIGNGLALLVGLFLIWGAAFYEIGRDRTERLQEAELLSQIKAQVYAEATRPALKRLDQLLLDLRTDWNGDPQRFAASVAMRQGLFRDLAFQIAVIDAKGLLAFSSLETDRSPIDLSDRLHFHFHRDAAGEDRLYISRPLKGRITGLWKIQFTRPILRQGRFDGVIVASVTPGYFAGLHDALALGDDSTSTILRDSGEVMARHPNLEGTLGQIVEWPHSGVTEPRSGQYRFVSPLDGIERIFGYYALPEYGWSFLAGLPVATILAPHEARRQTLLLAGSGLSVVYTMILMLLWNARKARREALGALHSFNRDFRALLDQAGDFIYFKDMGGRFRFCSQSLASLAGRTDWREMVGKRGEEVFPVTQGSLHEDDDATLLIGRQPLLDKTLAYCDADGHPRHMRINRWPLFDTAGEVTGILAVGRDITMQLQAEAELRQAKQAAEAANLAKSRFLATMSHEIRTPMNGILGMAQLLDMDGLTESERHEYARVILDSGQILLALLNDILDLSKIEAGKLTLENGLVGPQEILRETEKLFASSAQAKGLELSAVWQGPDDRCYRGDPHRLRQMLGNLVGNAIKFTSSGGVRIEGRELPGDGSKPVLEFFVVDTGTGIPADKQAILFQPFSQADSSITREFGGTGLGLSIVRNLAHMMDGEVGVHSVPGQGACFWFRIRLEQRYDDDDSRTAAPQPYSEIKNREPINE